MTPERYQLIDQIFRTALELDPDQRAPFLDEACGADATLRSEVDSLIASDRDGLSYIDDHALNVAARLLASGEPELSPGTRIDHYDLIALLGSGGMGEVYLARDEKLNRKIALKLLPPVFTINHERLRRFQQEARAASALNHPNIITIYEIGQVEERHFIATEFVDGKTLRERLKNPPLDFHESLDIAIQVCSALGAAHRKGIVHRDIKPENIMVRHDGYVKVLDFGLAKLAVQSEQANEIKDPVSVDISSGLIMGTVKYMSPEQALGEPVDQRSDVFSLGVMFYEMFTGHLPFAGETTNDLVSAIVREKPRSLKHVSDVPDELERIVNKSLHKDKEARYQTAEQMLKDLTRLKEQTATQSAADLASLTKQHKVSASLTLAVLIIAFAGTILGINRLFKGQHRPFQESKVTNLTNFDDAWTPAISPDGRHVAYVKGTDTTGNHKNSLWLKIVGTNNEVQLVPATEGTIRVGDFSPDGTHLSFGVWPGSTFVIPTSGGDATALPLPGSYLVTFSPDGRNLAYLDNRLSEGKTVLVVANADGTGMRDVVTRQAPNYFWNAFKPSWSPDGKLIACIAQNGNESFGRVFQIDINTGMERPITTQRWTTIRGVAWLRDMSGLLVVAAEETSSILQIWEISYPNGETHRITNDTVNYFGIGLSADGKTIVTTKVEGPTSIWVMPVDAGQASMDNKSLSVGLSKAKQINITNFTGTSDFEAYARLSWGADGRIVYMSEESGNADIWSMNADGSDRRQLTIDPHVDTHPAVSPDGRYIAFMSDRAGAENIWLMDMDGGHQQRLTSKLIERMPVFSGDNKWVYFMSWETGKSTIWKVSVTGGQPVQVIADLSFAPEISPDGKLLAYDGEDRILVTSSQGGPPIKSFPDHDWRDYSWTPDGRALIYVSMRDNLNLWEQPLDGGEPRQLTNFVSDGMRTSMYALSPDGKQLVMARTKSTSDIVLISEGQ